MSKNAVIFIISILFLNFALLSGRVGASDNKNKVYKSLKELKYKIVYPGHLPAGYQIMKIEKLPSSDYVDYRIEFCDTKKNCCEIYSGHELGDPLLDVTEKTAKKNIKSSIFGDSILYLVTKKEHQTWLDEYSDGKKSTSYNKNVVKTDWLKIKNNTTSVSYVFQCVGLKNAVAQKIFTDLEITN